MHYAVLNLRVTWCILHCDRAAGGALCAVSTVLQRGIEPRAKKAHIWHESVRRDLKTMSEFLNVQYLRGTRMVSVYRSTFCPRSQKPAGVQKCHSYLLIPPGSPGRSISGRGNAWNIEF